MQSYRSARPTYRSILAIAVPIMISNVSTPLLGAVDTAIMGRTPDPAYIGAVALGALVFNFLFWGFGFLRMGTTGLTAQALGARDADELRASLGRALIIAGVVGVGLIALQWPIRELAFALLEGTDKVESLARQYYDVRIWAAPATLANYALLGWFIGLARTRIALALQLVLNLINIALNLVFVLVLNFGVEGVALGTVLAEILATVVGLVIAVSILSPAGGKLDLQRLLAPEPIKRTIAVNRDIMIRSAALIVAFAWFMAQGARQGDTILAVNAVLMQFIGVSAFFLDGLAFAAEALVGQAIGAKSRAQLLDASRMTTVLAALTALGLTLAFALCAPAAIDLFSVDASVRTVARSYMAFAVLAPLVGVWCFQLDGIFIGATRTVEMRNAMLLSLAIFLAAWWALSAFGNYGLWAALYVHYAARAATLLYFLPGVLRSLAH
jgi:MATE family multidrug resistance protein